MARWEWTKETQEEFQKMQDKCSEFAMDLDKFRENVTRDRCEGNSMQEIDNCVLFTAGVDDWQKSKL